MTACARPAEAPVTRVELIWLEGRLERWIRFGAVLEETRHDRRRRTVTFAAGSVFAFVRWAANDFGTAVSRLDVVRAAVPGAPYTTVAHVAPGGDILLRQSGWPKVQSVLAAIDQIEALAIDPALVAPDYWRHLHNRLAAGQPARAYTRARHAAWRLRQRAGQ
jgi:hypothetical protein